MQPLSFCECKLAGLKVIQPFVAPDHRGFLLKSFEHGIFEQNGIILTVVTDTTHKAMEELCGMILI